MNPPHTDRKLISMESRDARAAVPTIPVPILTTPVPPGPPVRMLEAPLVSLSGRRPPPRWYACS